MVIGICGGSGSGKTTLLRRLSEYYKTLKPSIFSMDNYYKPIQHQSLDSNGQVNFDLPHALNQEKLFLDLRSLLNGETIEVKEYHFNTPPEKHVLITIEPSELIIVEGLFSFYYEQVRSIIDFSIFIDVDLEVQLDRRLYRDQETRGYSREAILYQWNNHVIPCYEAYLLPYQKNADFQFRNNHHADVDFENLVKSINQKFKLNKIEI
jgi:uridine kinase